MSETIQEQVSSLNKRISYNAASIRKIQYQADKQRDSLSVVYKRTENLLDTITLLQETVGKIITVVDALEKRNVS